MAWPARRRTVTSVPRYLVERSFEGPAPSAPERVAAILGGNDRVGVTWIHSYVSGDGHQMYCLYEAPSPEAVRRAARLNGLPVDAITEVALVDPFPYR
jgi:hypothetical protein